MTFFHFSFSSLNCRWQFFNKPQNRSWNSNVFPLFPRIFSSLKTAPLSEVSICNGNLKKKVLLLVSLFLPNIRSEDTINLKRLWKKVSKNDFEKPFPIYLCFSLLSKKFCSSSPRIFCTGMSCFSRHYLIVKFLLFRHVGQNKHLVLKPLG